MSIYKGQQSNLVQNCVAGATPCILYLEQGSCNNVALMIFFFSKRATLLQLGTGHLFGIWEFYNLPVGILSTVVKIITGILSFCLL